MIAAFVTEHPPTVHAVFQIVRQGLKVKAYGYCKAEGNAADGSFQIPDWVFDGQRSIYRPLQTAVFQGPTWNVCPGCCAEVRARATPPRT